jgi:ATP-binding cassette subfamily F protein 3
VSHDRHMLSTVVDELLLVADGKVNEFPGDLATYNKMVLSSSIGASSTVTNSVTEVVTPSFDRKERKRLEANFRSSVSPLKKCLKKFEQQMEKLEQELVGIELQLGDSALYELANTEQLKELLLLQGQKKVSLEELECSWMEQQEELEQLTSDFEQSITT